MLNDNNGEKRSLSEAMNQYRNLLWASVFLMMMGSFAYTTMAFVNLQKGLNDNALAITIVNQEARATREKQILAVGNAEFVHKRLQEQIDDVKERVQRGKRD